MEYPKLKREQKQSAKLTDAQASEIVAKWREGSRKSDLARQYGVTVQAVFWICLPLKERVRRSRLNHENRRKRVTKQEKAVLSRKMRDKRYAVHANYQEYERKQAYATKHDGEERPDYLDNLTDSEKHRLAGVKGGEVVKRKGKKYYQAIVNKRWNNPDLPTYGSHN